ncbi:uncharacterized protein FIBRA_00044 [Fibroporia radiculosa]|uniref:Aminoglycoside phosphotransferase domain-containing protein n=1 Tax=Fibroporia radiculosa TaxID=599839 RepID=J7RUQ6_9APHY|nr:uncharacterized protein FIBRA_00044 [Fibroporia radiculosa]CCL98050.1 predicted protein [Fibroporia radiculosa]
MQFAHDELGIPTPNVFSWSSRADSAENQVRAEYIFMERVPGVKALDHWENIEEPVGNPLTADLFDIENKLNRVQFSQFGIWTGEEDTLQRAAERYQYRGERKEMDLDRGLWSNYSDFMIASAENERTWIKCFASTSPVNQYSLQPADPQVHLRTLDMYKAIAPHIVPSSPMSDATLLHPEIDLSKILVSESGPVNILAVTNWRGAYIGLYCTQPPFPTFMDLEDGQLNISLEALPSQLPWMVEPPSQVKSLFAELQETIYSHLRLAARKRYYVYMTLKDKRRAEASEVPHAKHLALLPYWTVKSWDSGWLYVADYLLEI